MIKRMLAALLTHGFQHYGKVPRVKELSSDPTHLMPSTEEEYKYGDLISIEDHLDRAEKSAFVDV